MDLSSAKAKKEKLDDAVCGKLPNTPKVSRPECPVIIHGSAEYHDFFKSLNTNFSKSATLMSKELYHKSFIPKSATGELPKPIMSYRMEESLKLSHEQLKNECQSFSLTLTAKQVSCLERETRKQSQSRIWYTHRAGRVTASKLKSVVRTDPEKPSKSLVKCICYPEAHRFSNEATRFVRINRS